MTAPLVTVHYSRRPCAVVRPGDRMTSMLSRTNCDGCIDIQKEISDEPTRDEAIDLVEHTIPIDYDYRPIAAAVVDGLARLGFTLIRTEQEH